MRRLLAALALVVTLGSAWPPARADVVPAPRVIDGQLWVYKPNHIAYVYQWWDGIGWEFVGWEVW